MEPIITEALRYLGASPANAALRADLSVLAEELQRRITPRYTWALTETAALALPGRSARVMLAECPTAAVLVCTLGAEFDLWMRQLQHRDMARVVMLDALGSAYVESGCDTAEKAIPSYGDLPLSVQPALLDLAGASRIGVAVTPSLLMTPQKSVSAIIGLADSPQPARIRGCTYCSMNKTCQYRNKGIICHV